MIKKKGGELIKPIKEDRYWTESIEKILAGIGEKANCMSKLCTLASKHYDKQRTYLLLPASIISWGLNIFGMVATYMGPDDISEPFVILVASIGNFVVATLTTVAEKSKAGDKVELFNQASKEFYLLYSNISAELSFEPKQRCLPLDLLKTSRDRYNVLLQSNPNIPDSVIKIFWMKAMARKVDQNVSFPDHILNLQSIYIYRPEREENETKFIKGIKDAPNIVNEKDKKNNLKSKVIEIDIKDEGLNNKGEKELLELSQP